MLFAESSRSAKMKECSHPGCTNFVSAQSHKHYCSDPRCVEDREEQQKELYKTNRKNSCIYPETINVIIPKKSVLMNKILRIQCSASSCKHGRCKNTFLVPYSLARRTYPRYCNEHRNEYRRTRWEAGLL